MPARLIILFCLLTITAQSQRIKEILIEIDTAGQNITYGTNVKFKFFTVNKKGKKKEVDFARLNDKISATCLTPECSTKYGELIFPQHTSNKTLSAGFIRFQSIDPDLQLDKSFEAKMNFKGPLSINYKGQEGTKGLNGNNGGIPIVFRDGETGEQGGNGSNGLPGRNITVKIKKEYDEQYKKEIFFFYVKDDSITGENIFRCINVEKGVDIDVSGGNGGAGGSGGEGSRGKHGNAEGKKSPGDGGNGGYGGNGGNGSKGGKVTVIAHTNASEILGYLRINNAGGLPGEAGQGGKGGAGGNGDSGQSDGRTGTSGGSGNMGLPGEQGPNYELRVEEF